MRMEPRCRCQSGGEGGCAARGAAGNTKKQLEITTISSCFSACGQFRLDKSCRRIQISCFLGAALLRKMHIRACRTGVLLPRCIALNRHEHGVVTVLSEQNVRTRILRVVDAAVYAVLWPIDVHWAFTTFPSAPARPVAGKDDGNARYRERQGMPLFPWKYCTHGQAVSYLLPHFSVRKWKADAERVQPSSWP